MKNVFKCANIAYKASSAAGALGLGASLLANPMTYATAAAACAAPVGAPVVLATAVVYAAMSMGAFAACSMAPYLAYDLGKLCLGTSNSHEQTTFDGFNVELPEVDMTGLDSTLLEC